VDSPRTSIKYYSYNRHLNNYSFVLSKELLLFQRSYTTYQDPRYYNGDARQTIIDSLESILLEYSKIEVISYYDIQITTYAFKALGLIPFVPKFIKTVMLNKNCRKPDVVSIFIWLAYLLKGGNTQSHIWPLGTITIIGKRLIEILVKNQFDEVKEFTHGTIEFINRGYAHGSTKQHHLNSKGLTSSEKKLFLCSET
jgi:hypothetical protein